MSGRSSESIKGKARNGTGKRFTEEFLGFVDVPLVERDRAELEVWAAPGQVNIGDFLANLTEAGYKFSLSADVPHNSYIATATGKADSCENKGYALSGRGPSALGAIVVLWYKVDVLCHWGSWIEQGTLGDTQLPLWR